MNKENRIKSFTDLYAWQKGHLLVLEVYKITKEYPKTAYSLIDQTQRAAVSITSNIAEGFGRQTYKEKIQFYYMAQGSISELKNLEPIASPIRRETGEIISEKQKLIRSRNPVTTTSDFCFAAIISPVAAANEFCNGFLLLIARDIGYVKLSNDLIELSNDTHRLLQGLITASKQRK